MSNSLQPQSPVIIIGMHRSGTSLLTQLLKDVGFFVGKELDDHHEAVFFYKLNNWLLRQTGARWDYPDRFTYMLEDRSVQDLNIRYLRYIMKTRHAVSFLGWRNYLKYRDITKLDKPWGWKDPRTTITLPLWMQIFPQAKIIHIYRHGVDVAESLSKRYRKRNRLDTTPPKPFWLYWLRPKLSGFVGGDISLASLDVCFSLWEQYFNVARTHVKQWPEQSLEIQYEELLKSPVETMGTVLDFCDFRSKPATLQEVTSEVNISRAYSYQNDERLSAFADQVQDRLKLYGY